MILQFVFIDGDEGSDGVPTPGYQGRSASSSQTGVKPVRNREASAAPLLLP